MQAHKPTVLKNRSLTVERTEKFVSKVYFTDVNLYGRLYGETEQVKLGVYSVPDLERLPYSQVIGKLTFVYICLNCRIELLFLQIEQGVFEPTKVGQSFGPSWSTHWYAWIEFNPLSNN